MAASLVSRAPFEVHTATATMLPPQHFPPALKALYGTLHDICLGGTSVPPAVRPFGLGIVTAESYPAELTFHWQKHQDADEKHHLPWVGSGGENGRDREMWEEWAILGWKGGLINGRAEAEEVEPNFPTHFHGRQCVPLVAWLHFHWILNFTGYSILLIEPFVGWRQMMWHSGCGGGAGVGEDPVVLQ